MAAAKHGERGMRGWRKLHLGVDEFGVIEGKRMTDSSADDARIGVDLVDAAPGDVRWVIGDAAYDATDLYAAAVRRGARTIVPPAKNAKVKRRRAPERNRTLL